MTIAIKFTHRDSQLCKALPSKNIFSGFLQSFYTHKFILFMIDDILWDSYKKQKKILHVSVTNGSKAFNFKGVTNSEIESTVGHFRLTLMKIIFSHLIYD